MPGKRQVIYRRQATQPGCGYRTCGVAVEHAALSRPRSGVRIPSGPSPWVISSAWLERRSDIAEGSGPNPLSPTYATVVQWWKLAANFARGSLTAEIREFNSRRSHMPP